MPKFVKTCDMVAASNSDNDTQPRTINLRHKRALNSIPVNTQKQNVLPVATKMPPVFPVHNKRKIKAQNDKENRVEGVRRSKRIKNNGTNVVDFTKFDEKEIEIANFLNDLKQKRLDSINNSELKGKDSDTSLLSSQLNFSMPTEYQIKETKLAEPVSNFLENFELNTDQEKGNENEKSAEIFDRSIEISFIKYGDNVNDGKDSVFLEESITNKIPDNTEHTSFILEKQDPNHCDITLNLLCHSDTSYDLENASPLRFLDEELDKNNNLVLKHPKLKSFVVTTNLNEPINKREKPANNLIPNESTHLAGDLNMLNKIGIMNFNQLNDNDSFSSTPSKQTYNWKFFRKIFGSNDDVSDLGLTVCREANFNYENVPTPAFEMETIETSEQNKDLEESMSLSNQTNEGNKENLNAEVNVEEKVSRSERKSLRPAASKSKINVSSSPENEELQFAFKMSVELFSLDELSNGIFCEKDKNNKPINRSRVRQSFDEHKTNIIIKALQREFNYDNEKIKDVWRFIRLDLNKKIYNKYGIKKKSPK